MGSDHRHGAALCALHCLGDGKGFFSRDKAHLLDGLAAATKELLLAGEGTAFDAIGIEVDHHAADFAAGERDDGHGIGARDPTDQPGVRWRRQGRRHAACVALAEPSRLGRVLGPLETTQPPTPLCCRLAAVVLQTDQMQKTVSPCWKVKKHGLPVCASAEKDAPQLYARRHRL